MSIAALLQAAEYLERRDREAEHGYAVSVTSFLVRVMAEVLKTRPLHQMIMSFQRPTIVED